MRIRNKATRRNDNMLCSAISKVTVISPSAEELRIAQQEMAMWTAYRAELDRIARTPVGDPEPFIPHEDIKEDVVEEKKSVAEAPSPLLGHARYEITDLGPTHLYPTGKNEHTSGDKHYGPIARKSDEVKSRRYHGKPKGRSYSQLKKFGTPLTAGDFSPADEENG